MNHSISKTAQKPEKPYADFPLFPHATGRWAKKIKGKLHYFGPWSDPDGALALYLHNQHALHAGLISKPRPAGDGDGLTVKELVNTFLTSKQTAVDNGELSPRTMRDYLATGTEVADVLGRSRVVSSLTPADFAKLRAVLAKRLGPVRLGNTIQRVRSIFKYAYDCELIEKPIRFGPDFKRPAKRLIREARYRAEARMYERDELVQIIALAGVPMKAIILLGINTGFGAQDCSDLNTEHLDLEAGFVSMPRSKTGIRRRAKLWPETLKAIKAAIKARPKPAQRTDANAVFLTTFGRRWVRVEPAQSEDAMGAVPVDAIAQEFRKYQDTAGTFRAGRAFYSLRRTFRTIAEECSDERAVNLIMGHGDHSMADHYIEKTDDARLVKIAEHVRAWLWPKASKRKPTAKAGTNRKSK